MEVQISTAIAERRRSLFTSPRVAISLYLETAKARLSSLVLLTTIVGYVLAARGNGSISGLLWVVVGTALSAFGANILNQLWEVERDRLMDRTRNRPLPSGRLSRSTATLWGVGSSLLGVGLLWSTVNGITAVLALAVVLLYVLVYTPLKVRTPLSTVVGAVCGAIPPMMGWTAATNRIDDGAWVLFGILFVWQIPHFLALVWLYREDYERGGFKLMPAVDKDGSIGARVAMLYSLALVPLCTSITLAGVSGTAFLFASLLLTGAFIGLGIPFLTERSNRTARRLFFASILYLPLLLGFMVADMDGRLSKILPLSAPNLASSASVADSPTAIAEVTTAPQS